jgi:hypothetical protein
LVPTHIRVLLLVYGLANAALYSSLLPLWEGFDEEFHYGYVQYLEQHGRFPELGKAGLSEEINRSIDLLPMSHVMIDNLHLKGVRTFAEYFALPAGERRELHTTAQQIPFTAQARETARHYGNYEVHHAPLAYLLMALPDSLLSHTLPIPRRVWMVRLVASIASVLLVVHGTLALGREAGLQPNYNAALAFLTLSSQMFWATIAHIGNDWLSVPLAIWLIVCGLRCHRDPSSRNALWFGVALGLGLLSKAYFLVFVPLFVLAVLIWWRTRRLPLKTAALTLAIPVLISGWWYARNLLISGNLSGRIEESSGVTIGGALRALAAIPWLKSIPFMARGAFWMGNSTFSDFSVKTMNTVLLLLCAGLALCAWHRRRSISDLFLWSPVLLFCAAMIYVTGSSYTYTKGLATAASPWYLQAVMVPLLCLALLGYQSARAAGRWLVSANVLLWGYVLAATYLAKLIPLYGGFGGGRSTLREIVHWYATDWPRTADILSTTALLPATGIIALLTLVLTVLLWLMVVLVNNEHRV